MSASSGSGPLSSGDLALSVDSVHDGRSKGCQIDQIPAFPGFPGRFRCRGISSLALLVSRRYSSSDDVVLDGFVRVQDMPSGQ